MYQIDLFLKHPIETQYEVFHTLVKTASNTLWGKKYVYEEIDSIQHFQERVPVSTYENLFPFIEKALHGRENILWPGAVKWFSRSSGTTNDRFKFIPVTKESLDDCHFKAGKDMLAIYLDNRPNSKLFDGKGLPLGGSHEISKLNQHSYYGDLSAILIQNTPIFFELFRATAKKVALIPDWESKIEKLAEAVISQNVTSLAGIPTWTLNLFRKLTEISGEAKHILEIWPHLEVYFHGGVSFQPYRNQIRQYLPGDQVQFIETYNASEGFFGLQNDPHSQDMLLMLDYGIFYEFMPLGELGKEFPKTLTLDEVELDTTYALIISTNGGLWRYLVGDTIRFTSLYPFKIRVAGRTRHFINVFGEELMVESAELAITAACKKTDSEIEDFTAAPIYPSEERAGAHEWLIEFRKRPEDMQYFIEVLDNTLKSLNSDYESKRYKNFALDTPIVHELPEGTFYRWLKKKGKLGGQNKVPRLFNQRDYIEDILGMLSDSPINGAG